MERQYGKNCTQKYGGSKLQARLKRVFFVTVAGLGVLIFVLSMIYKVFNDYVTSFPEKKIADNVYIGGMRVSGLTGKEAKKKLLDRMEISKTKSVKIKVRDEIIEISLDTLAIQYRDIDALVIRAVEYGKEGSLWNRYLTMKRLERKKTVLSEELMIDREKCREILKKESQRFLSAPVSAKINIKMGQVAVEAGTAGEVIDSEDTLKKISEHINKTWDHKDFSVDSRVLEESPEIGEEDLKDIKDKLGEYSTDAGGGERWTNLRVGAEKINGILLKPGEKLSLNEVTGPYDETSDYVTAGAFENGRVVESLGGGICQVTSTLYNAVLYAELEVVERSSHSLAVTYVEPARDAAIAEGVMDFVIRNNYDTAVYILAEITDDNQIYIAIYGKETRDPGRIVKYKSEVVSQEGSNIIYQADYNQNVGYFSTTQIPFPGSSAILWKGVSENGEEMTWEEVNKSHYQKVDQIISVGVKTEGGASGAVLEAIGTQDYNIIAGAAGYGG